MDGASLWYDQFSEPLTENANGRFQRPSETNRISVLKRHSRRPNSLAGPVLIVETILHDTACANIPNTRQMCSNVLVNRSGVVMEIPNPAYRVPVSYIDKSRDYYAAHGYPDPYRWAHNDDSPFQPPLKPLSDCRVAIVTTTTRLSATETVETDPDTRPPKTTYAAPIDPIPVAMYTLDLSWDKEATHTRDVESFLPLRTMQAFAAEGRIGRLADRFYGVPTEFSQRRTNTLDAPQVLRLCREDNVDVVILVPL